MGVSKNTKVFRSFLLSKSIIPSFPLLLLPRRCCSPPTPAGASSSTPLVRALVAFTNKHTNKPRPSRLFIPFHFNNYSPFLTRRRTLAAAFTNIQTNRMRPSRSPPPLTPTKKSPSLTRRLLRPRGVLPPHAAGHERAGPGPRQYRLLLLRHARHGRHALPLPLLALLQ